MAVRANRGKRRGVFALFAVFLSGTAALAGALVAFLLAPHWSEASVPIASPPLPIVIGGGIFNVPPAAIRIGVQRRSGPQERLDLAYLWPDLAPPDPNVASTAPRMFVTVEAGQPAALSAAQRLQSVYPRYIDETPATDAGGLTVAPFADGTPYQGEDVVYDAAAPERFLARCSRHVAGPTLAMCLYERTVGGAALTFRFPREWLADWRGVIGATDRLIAGWRQSAATAAARP
jgi:hypothetical protein